MTRQERLQIAEAYEEAERQIHALRAELVTEQRAHAQTKASLTISRGTLEVFHWRGDLACAAAFDAERYRLALEAIAAHPHNAYDFQPPDHGTGRQYEIGVTDGHRCAANVALHALGKST